MYEELVKRLQTMHPEEYDNLMDFAYGAQQAMCEAAEAVEEMANKLCDWCGVCPKEKRRPWECEIMWPNAPVPEVWIDPPKEET